MFDVAWLVVASMYDAYDIVRSRTIYRRCHRATQPACRALAYEALSSSPLCNATGMSYACVRGLIIVAIMRHDRHVVRSRTRPYRCRHRATRPACRTLAYKALSSSPVWRRDWHVVRLRTRPGCRRRRATRRVVVRLRTRPGRRRCRATRHVVVRLCTRPCRRRRRATRRVVVHLRTRPCRRRCRATHASN